MAKKLEFKGRADRGYRFSDGEGNLYVVSLPDEAPRLLSALDEPLGSSKDGFRLCRLIPLLKRAEVLDRVDETSGQTNAELTTARDAWYLLVCSEDQARAGELADLTADDEGVLEYIKGADIEPVA